MRVPWRRWPELGHAYAMLECRSRRALRVLGGHRPPPAPPFSPGARQGSLWGGGWGLEFGKTSGRPARRAKLAFCSPRGVSCSGVPSPSAPNNELFGVGEPGPKTKLAAQSRLPRRRSRCGMRGPARGWRRDAGARRPKRAPLHLEGAGSGRASVNHPFREEGGSRVPHCGVPTRDGFLSSGCMTERCVQSYGRR